MAGTILTAVIALVVVNLLLLAIALIVDGWPPKAETPRHCACPERLNLQTAIAVEMDGTHHTSHLCQPIREVL